MSKYNTDLDYVILGIDISREELEEIRAEAEKVISENKESKENLALAYLKRAQCQRRLKQQIVPAGIHYDKIGIIFEKKDKKEENIKKLLEKALELIPNMPEALMQLGLLNIDKEGKAIKIISKAIQLKADYAAAFNNRALLYCNPMDGFEFYLPPVYDSKDKINFRNAVADLTEAIKIRPFDALYHLNRGLIHLRLGEHKEAIEDFSSAIKYASDALKDQLNTEVLIFNLRGKEYTELKDYDKAIEDFSESLSLKPNHDETLLLRGKAYYLAGEKDKAKADIEENLNRKRIVAEENNRNEILKIVGVKPEDILL
jgi:tetratricopeptide (TPR) repeat protein